MTSSAAAPLPVLYLAPPDPGMHEDLLLHEVAACVAAVGHRLHVRPCPHPTGAVRDGVAAFAAEHGRNPVLVLRGGPGEAAPGVVAVALDGTGPAGLTLPSQSRSLCRLLARAAQPEGTGRRSGRAVVLVHHGEGPAGDAGWPGLSWGLTLLLGGPGRGVLVDLQGPRGGLHQRLARAAGPGRTVAFPPLAPAPTPAPTPGPALAARLPMTGTVRWWSAATDEVPVLLPGIGAAVDTFAWTVLDTGRNRRLAAGLAAEQLPLLTATRRGRGCRLQFAPGPVGLDDTGLDGAGLDGTGLDGVGLELNPAPWTGLTPASWGRAARHRDAIALAVRLDAALSHEPEGTRR